MYETALCLGAVALGAIWYRAHRTAAILRGEIFWAQKHYERAIELVTGDLEMFGELSDMMAELIAILDWHSQGSPFGDLDFDPSNRISDRLLERTTL